MIAWTAWRMTSSKFPNSTMAHTIHQQVGALSLFIWIYAKNTHTHTHTHTHTGTVLFYMLRMEPFSTHAIHLQDGKFDHSDRLFHSIPQAWQGCQESSADVKELIPEFFYMAEIFRNANGFDLGAKQTVFSALSCVCAALAFSSRPLSTGRGTERRLITPLGAHS